MAEPHDDEGPELIEATHDGEDGWGVAIVPIDGEPTVSLQVFDESHERTEAVEVAPWELSALADLATGRPTRLPRLTEMPGAAESAPFDIVIGAILREQRCDIDTREAPMRMAQRSRANRALEIGDPAFDIVMRLVVPGNVMAATTTVIGVPGTEVTQTAMYWAAHVLRSASEKLPSAQKAAAEARARP